MLKYEKKKCLISAKLIINHNILIILEATDISKKYKHLRKRSVPDKGRSSVVKFLSQHIRLQGYFH